jgi:hypothetical protein
MQIELTPANKPVVKMAYSGKLSEGYLKRIYDKVNALSPLYSRSDIIKFHLRFNI